LDNGDKVVDWTGAQPKRLGVKSLIAGHCTGIEANWRHRPAKRAPRLSAGRPLQFRIRPAVRPADDCRVA
jgi:hypothetical protein